MTPPPPPPLKAPFTATPLPIHHPFLPLKILIILWACLSNFGSFTMLAHQIWSCHVTQDANFEKFLFYPNSTLNIRKTHKGCSEKALYFRSSQPKTSWIWGGGGGGGRVETPSSFKVKFGHRDRIMNKKHISPIGKESLMHSKLEFCPLFF